MKYQSLGRSNVMVFGDFNARTSNLVDFYIADKFNNVFDDNGDCQVPNDMNITGRHNMDVTINEYGRVLIELCKKADMRILNGRVLGDLHGAFTCHHYNGSSCVDYCIVDSCLLDQIQYFKVFDILSDHCMIGLLIKAGFYKPTLITIDCELSALPNRYIWNETSAESYKKIFNTNVMNQKIKRPENVNFYEEDINDSLDLYYTCNILHDTANISLKKANRNVPKNISKSNKIKSKKWYNIECLSTQKQLMRLGNMLCKSPKICTSEANILKRRKLTRKR